MKTQDNRLDYMSKFKEGTDRDMAAIRSFYEVLDSNLRYIVENKDDDGAAMRALSIARTHLETSLQYAIKTLCIVNEEKGTT